MKDIYINDRFGLITPRLLRSANASTEAASLLGMTIREYLRLTDDEVKQRLTLALPLEPAEQ